LLIDERMPTNLSAIFYVSPNSLYFDLVSINIAAMLC
jgi:hypothetical protein